MPLTCNFCQKQPTVEVDHGTYIARCHDFEVRAGDLGAVLDKWNSIFAEGPEAELASLRARLAEAVEERDQHIDLEKRTTDLLVLALKDAEDSGLKAVALQARVEELERGRTLCEASFPGCNEYKARAEALEEDAARWRYVNDHAEWRRHQGKDEYDESPYGYLMIRVPYEANLGSKGSREDVIDGLRREVGK